jgi:hypothetical protein
MKKRNYHQIYFTILVEEKSYRGDRAVINKYLYLPFSMYKAKFYKQNENPKVVQINT